MLQILPKKVNSPPGALGTRGTGPLRATGVLQPLKLITASILCLLLINIAWPRNHRLCVCLRRC